MPTTEQTPGKLGDAKVISKVYEKGGFGQRRLKDSLKFLPTRGDTGTRMFHLGLLLKNIYKRVFKEF